MKKSVTHSKKKIVDIGEYDIFAYHQLLDSM